jgi:predicted RNA-binding protein with PIN domain
MGKDLEELIRAAKLITMSESDKEEQRRSFAYGSAKIENDDITREMIDAEADRMKQQKVDG